MARSTRVGVEKFIRNQTEERKESKSEIYGSSRPAVKSKDPHGVDKPIPPKPLYDLFRAPISMFDWDSAGLLFNNEATGHNDLRLQQVFADLCGDYDILNFNLDKGLVYFLFKLRK